MIIREGDSILSWSVYEDNLRLWNLSGECLVVLEGHTDFIDRALFREDGSILSWTKGDNLLHWDSQGILLNSYTKLEGVLNFSDYREQTKTIGFCDNYILSEVGLSSGLYNLKELNNTAIAIWNSSTKNTFSFLFSNGKMIVSTIAETFHLQLYKGKSPIPLDQISEYDFLRQISNEEHQ